MTPQNTQGNVTKLPVRHTRKKHMRHPLDCFVTIRTPINMCERIPTMSNVLLVKGRPLWN